MNIALLGDVAFFGKFSLQNNPGAFSYFEDIKNFLSQFDYVVANLETPFVNGQNTHGIKSAYIGTVPKNIELLKFIGINVVNLANNHIFDYGIEGLNLTKKILLENNILFFGVEDRSVILKSKDAQVALGGYCCYSTNPMGIGKHEINELNFEEVKQWLIENSKIGYNNIISIHAGQEHVNYPNYDHIEFARSLSKFVPYVFYGHHPHVLQGIEKYGNSLLAYSLGNFCFDDVYTNKSTVPLVKQTDNNRSAIILCLEYKDTKLSGYKCIPIYAGSEKMVIHRQEILDNLEIYSGKLTLAKSEYVNMRNELWNIYLHSRKELRDFQWYYKRFNIKSLFMIISSRRNKRKYRENLKKYL
jgi:gamma-polyglutamate biosynthesis protein CapA